MSAAVEVKWEIRDETARLPRQRFTASSADRQRSTRERRLAPARTTRLLVTLEPFRASLTRGRTLAVGGRCRWPPARTRRRYSITGSPPQPTSFPWRLRERRARVLRPAIVLHQPR